MVLLHLAEDATEGGHTLDIGLYRLGDGARVRLAGQSGGESVSAGLIRLKVKLAS